jgi:hypothetical protein
MPQQGPKLMPARVSGKQMGKAGNQQAGKAALHGAKWIKLGINTKGLAQEIWNEIFKWYLVAWCR